MLIAIDGPAASGKGTIGKKIAEKFGLRYLDTGKLYRAVGYLMLEDLKQSGRDIDSASEQELKNLALNKAKIIDSELLQNDCLNNEGVGNAASIASAIAEVRQELLGFQRDFAKQNDAVLDGRDIGTVVCPEADHKFFITADAEIRAKRRFKQLQSKDLSVKESDILENILKRDKRDQERKNAPLVKSDNAVFIDSSNMSVKEVFEKVVDIINSSAKFPQE